MPQAPPTSRPLPASSEAAGPDPLTEAGHTAIVGLQWGDEGKGQIVDMLTPRFDMVTRFNGGNNAGHSVYVGDEKFALHLLPSGITYADKLNVIGNGVVVDPSPVTGILKEIDSITARGIGIGENLKISDRAHAVMPYHKTEDLLYEDAIAKARSEEGAYLGTTGRGIGPAYADKCYRSTAVRMGDLTDRPTLERKLRMAVAIKNVTLAALAEYCGKPFEPIDVEALVEEVAGWGERLAPHITDTRVLIRDAQNGGKHILFEGANAALLDVDHGTYPFGTSSSTSALGIGPGTGVPTTQLGNVVGVCKAYTTRVGTGPHPTELDAKSGEEEIGDRLRKVGNEFGTTTGRPRRCGWLDLTAVRYTAQINGCTALVCTGLSVLAGLDTIKVCVAYDYRGKRLAEFPPDADILAEATPVYETLPGFSGDTGAAKTFDELPDKAKAYVQFIEDFVGIPVRIACVGPKRAQALIRTA